MALKASSGASESLPLVSVDQPGNFIDACKNNGWKIYAAAAPRTNPRSKSDNYLDSSALGNPLRDHACVLILGSEGEGLPHYLQKRADYCVGIRGPRLGQGRVDSLNVSVAAGLLCEAFLRHPADVEKVGERSSDVSKAKHLKDSNLNNLLF